MRKESRYNDRKRYFDELATSSRKYFISYFRGFKKISGSSVLEIGCGEGGILLPFEEEGCEVTGVDVCSREDRECQGLLRGDRSRRHVCQLLPLFSG